MNKNDIYIIGEIGWENDLKSLIKDVEQSDKEKPLNIHIHSGGGSVYDGVAMYNYLKKLDQEVNTISAGLVASIASIIFLAGKKETRVMNETDSFLIHLPMNMAGGNAEDLEKTAEELRKWESQLADIYVEETDLTKEEALDLMKKDNFLDANFLQEKGFVNQIIKFKSVATINFKNEMSETVSKTEVDGLLAKWFNKFFPKNEINNKVVQDANGVEIDFTELEADAIPKVGDLANVDGKKASGDYVMPSGETYQFADGKLDAIVPKENEEPEPTPEEVMEAKIKTLEAELETSKDLLATANLEIENKKTEYETMKSEFIELKNNITSKFEYDGKDKKKEKVDQPKSRKLLKD